jgi:G3E family GTPase
VIDPRSAKIPVVIVTGFLGAGKTTLLNRLLSDPAFRDTAVVVNEFGDISVDHDLVRVGSRELMVTTTGCICCTASSDVRASLFELVEAARAHQAPSFSRVVIETTGLADPAPIVNSLTPGALPVTGLQAEDVEKNFRLASIVTCFDAITGELALERFFEAMKQVAFATTIVLTKTDLMNDAASRRDTAELEGRLAKINPSAKILYRAESEHSFKHFFEGAYAPSGEVEDLDGWLAIDRMLRLQVGDDDQASSSSHSSDIRAISLVSDGAMTRSALDCLLMLLSRTAGASLLRVKGLVRLADDPDRPAVVHAVQHLMHPVSRLPDWPNEDRRTRIVVIGRGHDERALTDVFHSLMGAGVAAQPQSSWGIAAFAVACLFAIALGAVIASLIGWDAGPIRQLLSPPTGDH